MSVVELASGSHSPELIEHRLNPVIAEGRLGADHNVALRHLLHSAFLAASWLWDSVWHHITRKELLFHYNIFASPRFRLLEDAIGPQVPLMNITEPVVRHGNLHILINPPQAWHRNIDVLGRIEEYRWLVGGDKIADLF